jgi:ABC-type antimicrobial peptide transport system permease subunit
MNWTDTIRTAAEAVRTHRLRSALTMLGILIGITAVVLTVGLGAGAKADIQDQIDQLGTNGDGDVQPYNGSQCANRCCRCTGKSICDGLVCTSSFQRWQPDH